MRIHTAITLFALLALPAAARQQPGPGGPAQPLVTSAPREAGQFDFLVGRWELVAEPQVSALAALVHGAPKLPGTWKAWRGFDGFGIEDEMRITDKSGNPLALSSSVRIYDRTARHWSCSTVDVYRSHFQSATAEWKDGRMMVNARGTGADGRAFVSRSWFFDIRRDSFRWQQDVSYDEGRTWTKAKLKVEAKRVTAIAPR
jgi:hypothetical protein